MPDVRDVSWPLSEVDRFVLARLEAAGLKPAGPASKRTLIRRVTFDLIGLPPEPEEVHAFVADDSPGAFPRVVDRLLASPHYGERWGRHWLDVVRYADTAGETADYPVPEAYHYRDYVIDAFNADKPYDEFVREQIAGDILAREGPRETYAERVTATGYLAISRRFGFDVENYHHLTIQDTIDSVGQTFLGLSLGCARCHDHKYDPVTMDDYYALYGIFESTRYAFPGSEQKQRTRALAPLVPPDEAGPLGEDYARRVGRLEGELAHRKAAFPRIRLGSLDDLDGDFELQAPAAGGSRGVLVPPWLYEGGPAITAQAQSPYTNVYPGGTNGISLPGGGEACSLGQALHLPRTGGAPGPLHASFDFRIARTDPAAGAGTGPAGGSWRFFLGHEGVRSGRSAAVEAFIGSSAFAVGSGGAVESVRALVPDVWYHVQIACNLRGRRFSGTIGVPGDVTAFDGKIAAADWDGTIDRIRIDGAERQAGQRPALDLDNIAVRRREIPPLPSPALPVAVPAAPAPPPESSGPDGAGDPGVRGSEAEIRGQLAGLVEKGPFPMAYGVAEGTPRDARVQLRGEPSNPGEVAPRRFLEVLGGDRVLPEAAGSGRRELAGWLTRPSSSLTARVMVNRIWQHHFGRGLVATPNDFGVRGERPTHPELLDFLARRFVDGGWSVKSLHRLILLSRTYQTASEGDEGGAAAGGDPENRLLRHFLRRRLDAEAIRDAMLAASGLLDRTRGGRHPFPGTDGRAYTQHAPFRAVYETRRRSVYLMTQRIQRHPYLALFDGADSNASTAVRVETTIPTQSLFLMNDPLVHEGSVALARRVLGSGREDVGRFCFAHELALARSASEEEVKEGLVFLQLYRQDLRAAGTPAPEEEEKAWAAYARTLFARNEFLFVD